MVMLNSGGRHNMGEVSHMEKDYETGELTGKTIFEGYLRQCTHCQYTWTYKPGSGVLRGFCNRCNGWTCGRFQCQTCYHKEKRIEDRETTGKILADGTWHRIEKRAAQVIEAALRRQELRETIYQQFRQR